MVKVQIYDTQEERLKQLGSIDDANLRTKETFHDLYRKALLEYKEESGFNERFNKSRDETLERKILFSAEEAALSDDERKKFNEQYRDLGRGLGFTILVELGYNGDKYIFGDGGNYSAPFLIEDEEHDNLASLTQGVKKALSELNSELNFWEATVTTVVYTTREKLSVPENISDDSEGYLRVLKEEVDKSRGLTDEECAEFERLYNSNTP